MELESLPRQWLGHPFSPSLTKVRWIKGIEGLRRLHSFLSPFLCDQLGLLDFYPSCPAHQKLVCQNGLTAFNAFNVLQKMHSVMSIFSNSCLRISHKVGTLPENVTGLHQEELCMIWIQLPKMPVPMHFGHCHPCSALKIYGVKLYDEPPWKRTSWVRCKHIPWNQKHSISSCWNDFRCQEHKSLIKFIGWPNHAKPKSNWNLQEPHPSNLSK